MLEIMAVILAVRVGVYGADREPTDPSAAVSRIPAHVTDNMHQS